MKRSTLLVVMLLMVSMMLASCAAPNIKTEAPVMETAAPTEMAAMETPVPTFTQEAAAVSTQIQSATDDSASMSEGAEVEIEDFAYAPITITIKVGTTVTWTNKDTVRHTVTSDTGLFDSGLFGKGETFSYTFSEAGLFPYYCAPHPYMKGTVIVE